jgi:hypothetical protein
MVRVTYDTLRSCLFTKLFEMKLLAAPETHRHVHFRPNTSAPNSKVRSGALDGSPVLRSLMGSGSWSAAWTPGVLGIVPVNPGNRTILGYFALPETEHVRKQGSTLSVYSLGYRDQRTCSPWVVACTLRMLLKHDYPIVPYCLQACMSTTPGLFVY